MHPRRVIILLFSGILLTPALAQPDVQERAANLRAQLSDVEMRQTELQSRLQQLDYDLKPTSRFALSHPGIKSEHPVSASGGRCDTRRESTDAFYAEFDTNRPR